jgi:hypothetical protein
MFNSEAIYAALFNQISGNPAFFTTSRRFVQCQDCDPASQPAVYQRTGNTKVSQSDDFGLPTYRYTAWWFLYCQVSPDEGTLPSSILNPLIAAAVNALLPPDGMLQTLGGTPTVVHAWVDGEILVYEGLLPADIRAWAVIPITILAGA